MKKTVVFLIAAAVLTVTVGAGVAFGSANVPFGAVFQVLAAKIGLAAPPGDPTTALIVWRLRLPRVALGFVVGGGLSVTGVAMQALVRNPLAEPYVLGISSGASAGVALYYLGFLPALLARALSLPLAAFAGSLSAIALVYWVARKEGRISVARLLLAGVAMSALMGAVSSLVTFASPNADKLRTVLFLLLGSLSGTQWTDLPVPALVTAIATVGLVAASRPLDALLMGEEPAHSLGVPVEALKRLLIGGAALVTGTLVAVSGTIGFVGLIVPHAVRLVAGVSHRRVVPLAFVGGGVFLVWADLAARLILPAQELPVGILTALCGVPFFLVLLRRRGYAFG